MAAAANLVLKDKADVNVTYSPVIIKTGEYAKYVDRTQGVLSLQSTAAISLKETDATRKVTGTVVFPVTVNATTGEISNVYGKFSFDIDKRVTANDRLDIRKRLSQMIDDAVVNSVVDNGETPW